MVVNFSVIKAARISFYVMGGAVDSAQITKFCSAQMSIEPSVNVQFIYVIYAILKLVFNKISHLINKNLKCT